MIKRFFWILLGVALAVFGVNYFKKKAAENPEQFSTDALIEKFIEIFDVVKEYVQGLWQGYSGSQTLNDRELEKIFVNKIDFEPEFDATIKQSDISLN
ncbi:MAG: hypothetical protein O3A62_00215 [Actinomycetota bacterium]|nr:hypothetical protein [Actinomycetota bacterium]MDA3003477.1 hypothetical protein [Actinomycetota bacterium]